MVGWVVKTEIPGHFCFAVSCPPYELGSGGVWCNLPCPLFGLRAGKAYQASNQGKEAAAEYQKILDHRGVVGNRPIGALAHLELGRASNLEGDTARARTAYQDFLALWKDVDPNIPILLAAQSEYAKLK